MALALGDYAQSSVIDFYFTSNDATGLPTVLAGTPVIQVYKGNSSTQSTSGTTLDVSFDSVTGYNHARIDTSSDLTFYSSGGQFTVMLSAGTVGGISVVGYVLARFTLNAANVATGSIGTVTTTTNLTNAPTSGDLTAAMKASVTTAATAATPTAAAVTGAVGSINGITFPMHFGALGITVGGAVSEVALVDTLTTYAGNTPQTGDSFARIGVAGVGLTNLGDTRIANLDATVSSRMATFSLPNDFALLTINGSGFVTYSNAAPPSAATIATATAAAVLANPTHLINTDASGDVIVGDYATGKDPATLVLDASAAAHDTAGTIGAAINNAGAGTNPWDIPTSGHTTAGSFGEAVVAGTAASISVANALPDNFSVMAISLSGEVSLAATTMAAIANTYLDLPDAIEVGLTPRKQMRLTAAGDGGVTSGAGTDTFTIKGAGVSTARVVATVDSDGNRSAVNLTL